MVGVGVACWRLQRVGKFTATSRVVRGKIDKTDTRRAECGLGTAIQAHCSDHVPATLMALTASRAERTRTVTAAAGLPPLPPSCLSGHMIIRRSVSSTKNMDVYSNELLLAARSTSPRPAVLTLERPLTYSGPVLPQSSDLAATVLLGRLLALAQLTLPRCAVLCCSLLYPVRKPRYA